MKMARGNTGFRIKKIVGWTGLILAMLAAVSGMAWYYAQSKDFFFSEIKNMTREMAGYDLSKSDPLSFALFPRPTLIVKNLEVSNPGLDQHALIADVGEMSVMLSWSALFRLELDLDVVLTAPQLSLDIDTGGARNWMTPELEEVTGNLPFDLVQIDITELGLMFRNHQSNELLGLDIHQFDINLRDGGGSARVETAGRVGKSRFFLLGEVAQQGADNRFTVDLDFGAGRARETRVDAIRAPSVSWWIRQNAVLFPLQGAVKGELELQQQLPWGELTAELATANLDEFLHLSDERLTLKSSIGPLRASGRVVLRGSDVDVRGLDTRIDQPDISLNLKGDVSNLLSVVETDLLLGARSNDLNSLVDTGTLIPVVGTRLADSSLETAIDVTIRSKGKQFVLKDGAVMLKQGSLSARLTGGLSVQENNLEYRAELQAEAPDFVDLTRILNIEKPANSGNDSVKITATLAGSEDRIDVEDARIDFQEGNYKLESGGTIDLTGESPVLDLHCQLDVLDAVAVKTYLSNLPDPFLQELSVALRTDVKGPAGDFELRNIELKMVHDQRKLVGKGTVSGLPENPEVAVDIHYSLQGALELDQYFPALGPQRLMGPLDLNGTVRYSDRRLVIDQLELMAEQTDVGGLIQMDFSKSPTQVVVLMDARDFKTGLVTAEPGTMAKNHSSPTPKAEPEADDAKPARAPSPTPDKSPGELFQEFTNSVEINTKWVNDLDFYMSFSADHANLGKYDIEALDMIIDARDGTFTVANYQITLQGRPMRLSGYVNVNTDPPTYLFAGNIEGETLEALLNLEEQIFEGGELSGEFVFLSEGNTLGEFIRQLAGQALIEMGPVVIRSRALNLVSSDILHSMLGGITRSKEEKKSTRYKCGVLGVDVNRGIARINQSFTLEAKDYNLAGKGKIDLNTGYVELAARPKAKKGLGISLSSVIGGFRVEGHIATPKFGLGGGGLVSAAVLGYALTPTMAAAAANPVTATIVATGFFAKGIFDRMTASSYSCKKTVERFERTRRREINPRRSQSGKMDI
jgi:hypothetical protein